jgi:ribonuclease VapC
MIIDSSAIVAIVRVEIDAETLSEIIEAASAIKISAASYLESSIVIDGYRKPELSARFDQFIEEMKLEIEPVTAEQVRIARQAYRDYGKGSGHRANLNFGDCFSYALARVKREPLLYKGDDFTHTDLRSGL